MADQFSRNLVIVGIVLAATIAGGVYMNKEAEKEAKYRALPKMGSYYGQSSIPSSDQSAERAGYTNCMAEYDKTGSAQLRDMCNAMRQSYVAKYKTEP